MLVGGSAQLQGMTDYTRERLQLAARIGSIQQVSGLIDTIDNPAYCTAIGLMTLDMFLGPDNDVDPGEPNSNFFGFLEGLWPFGERKK